jgi:hypothetical protein
MSKKLVCLASSVLAFGTVLTSITQAGLVGWWRFNEGSGDVASDSSGNNHDGALLGTPEWVAGPDGFGGALAFDPDGCIGVHSCPLGLLGWNGSNSALSHQVERMGRRYHDVPGRVVGCQFK